MKKKKEEKKWKELKRKEKQSSQGWKPGRAALAKVRVQKERVNTRVYLNPELRKAWFPCLGYVGNFILKSSRKTLQNLLCPWNGFDHLCLLCIREFGCHRHSEDWLQCAAMLSKQGATFHCHTVCRGAIQTRGNIPLPSSVLQTRGNIPLPWIRGCTSWE